LTARSALARALAGACVGVSALPVDGQTLAVTQPPGATGGHEPLDVLLHLPARVTLDLVTGLDGVTQGLDVSVAQLVDPALRRDAGLVADLEGLRAADAVDVRKGVAQRLAAGQVNSSDTCHDSVLSSASALTLLVPGVLADHAHDALPADDLALVTNLLDARTHLHRTLPSQCPRPFRSGLGDNSSPAGVVGGKLYGDSIADHESNDGVAKFNRGTCQDGLAVLQGHPEERLGSDLDHHTAESLSAFRSVASKLGRLSEVRRQKSSTHLLPEGGEEPFSHLLGRPNTVDASEQALLRVVRQESRGHGVVLIQSGRDRFLPIVGSMIEVRVGGRRIIFQVIDLSSPFVGPAQGGALHEELPVHIELN